MSRPAYHVDVATTAIPAWIAQPPGGIQTAGFPPHSKFAAAWANWLFNYLGEWVRELDQSCLRAIDYTSDLLPQLLKNSGDGFALPENAGLIDLAATDGGAYLVLGRRLDLTQAALAAKYPTGWTLPNNSTVYAHAREELGAGGSSTGEILISTNAVEPDYVQIWTGTTDATDLVSQSSTADTALQWTMPIDMFVPLTITDAVDETALTITAANTFAPAVLVTSTLGATVIQAEIGNSTGTGFAAGVNAGAGTGFSAVLTSSPNGAAGFRATLFGAGSAADGFLATHAGTGDGLHVDHSGAGDGLHVAASGAGFAGRFVSTGSGASSVSITGGASQALLATGSGTGDGGRFLSGSGAGANALTASTQNVSGFAFVASTVAGANSTARALKATATGTAVAAEIVAAGNYALMLQGDTTTPQWAELHFAGQSADPVQVFDGDLMWHTGQRQLKVSDASDMTFRGVWTSIGGHCHGRSVVSTATTMGGVTWTNAGTVNLTDSNAPKQANRRLEITWTADVRSMIGGAANTLDVRIRDTGSAVDIGFGAGVLAQRVGVGVGSTAGFYMPDTSTSWQRTVHLPVNYTTAPAGDLQIVVEIKTATANNIQVRGSTLTCDGLY